MELSHQYINMNSEKPENESLPKIIAIELPTRTLSEKSPNLSNSNWQKQTILLILFSYHLTKFLKLV